MFIGREGFVVHDWKVSIEKGVRKHLPESS